jgi:hypothetical protein
MRLLPDDERGDAVRYGLPVVAVLLWLCLYGMPSFGMAGVPPADMQCFEHYFPNPSTIYLRCTFPRNGSRYNSHNALADQVGVILIPRNPAQKLRLRAHFDGYQPDLTGWPTWNFADPCCAVLKVLPGHYPKLIDYAGMPLDWGGVFGGELSESWRLEALQWYVAVHYGTWIDWPAGLELEGRSYGAATASNISLLMPDRFTKTIITLVHSDGGPTNFVGTDPLSVFWLPQAQLAWTGFDYTLADPYLHASPGIFHRYNGGDPDQVVPRDSRQFVQEVCEDKRAPCFITFHNAGHYSTQLGTYLPYMETYPCTGMSHRLDQPQIAFTGSSANWMEGDIGHYNLGLCWRDSGMVNTATRTVIPIRYLRWTVLAVEVPDQPLSATFNTTVRNTRLPMRQGEELRWSLGAQSGTALVMKSGELDIFGLALDSSANYTNLEITR